MGESTDKAGSKPVKTVDEPGAENPQADEPKLAAPSKATPTVRDKTTTVKPSTYVRARILWPALGFPEVVAPKKKEEPDSPKAAAIQAKVGSQGGPPAVGDTRRIKLLLVANKKDLSAADVARHLRYVPWKNRHCRYLAPNPGKCSFSSKNIRVEKVKVNPKKANDFVQEVYFGAGYIAGGLSKFVLDFYKKAGLTELYQVWISESASADLKPGKPALYQLFWASPDVKAKPAQISEEMKLLIDRFAKGRRPDSDNSCKTHPVPEAYEYALVYGRNAAARVEVLHPLFVWDSEDHNPLRIAHLSDTHLALRADSFEKKLLSYTKDTDAYFAYNNYNKRFKELYGQAKKNGDVLLITGDLVEYARGFAGGQAPLGKDKSYALDLNWFLFYTLLAHADGDYRKPVYTVLGNHDWRLNPYGPLNPAEKQNLDVNLTEKQMEYAHGRYVSVPWYGPLLGSKLQLYGLVTCLDAVKWYLLLINPFLDYTVRLPGGYAFVMLDWAEDEMVISRPVQFTELSIAEDALTDIQVSLVKWFLTFKEKAKMLAQHAPIVSPWPGWSNEALNLGLIRPCPRCGGSGKRSKRSPLEKRYVSSTCECLNFRPQSRLGNRWLLTVLPNVAANTSIGETLETDKTELKTRPVYGSINHKRDWLIEQLHKNQVPLVCCGHTHRNSLFVIVQAGEYDISGTFGSGKKQLISGMGNTVGAYVMKGPREKDEYSGFVPPGTAIRIADHAVLPIPTKLYPLYVNTGSLGPVAKDWERDGTPLRLPPGYAETKLSSDGKVLSVEYKHSANVNPLQWECWLLKPSKAKWAKLHDGGIIARYDHWKDADAESEKGRAVWPKDGEHECWIRRKSSAAAVKVDKRDNKPNGIIGIYYDKEGKEAAIREKRADDVWQKWSID